MKIINQDILDVEHGILAHSVNCLGVMGSGLAKQIRDKWPRIYQVYRHKYDNGSLKLGDIQLVRVTEDNADLIVCNLAGQYAFGRDKQHTDYDAIHVGLEKLARWKMPLQIYIPFNMGCGLGGGDWKVISAIIETTIPDAIICRLEK